jgi:TPR repeat protein
MKSRTHKTKPTKIQIDALFTAADYLEESGELRAAFQCLLAAAEAGDEGSQLNLGNYYSDGTGVRKDLKKAAHWYRKAYNNQSRGVRCSSAAVNLGINFRNSGDLKTAISWFERARKLQDGSACLELARIHSARKGGRRKAMVLLHEVIELDGNFSTDADKEAAEAMLKVLSLH